MKKIKEKIMALFLGLIFTLIILEFFLRLFSFFYIDIRTIKNTRVHSQNAHEFVVLCFGNSHTFGIGAPVGESYPDHLGKMLQARFPEKNIHVINKGIPGINSTQVFHHLKKTLSTISPDLIILRTGGPNLWNHFLYSDYISNHHSHLTIRHKISILFNENLQKIKIYKLFQLISKNISKKKNTLTISIDQKRFPPEKQDPKYLKKELFFLYKGPLNKSIRLSSQCLYSLYVGKNFPLSEKKALTTISWLKEMVKKEPASWHYCLFIGSLFETLHQEQKAIKWYIAGANLFSQYVGEHINFNYLGISRIKNTTKDPAILRTIDAFIRKYQPLEGENPSINTKLIKQWVRYDLARMIKLIKSKSIPLIIQNYPPRSGWMEEHIKKINGILSDISNKHGILFVDQEELFKTLWAKEGVKKEDYQEVKFGITGTHFNSLGYKITAENIFKTIIENNLIFF